MAKRVTGPITFRLRFSDLQDVPCSLKGWSTMISTIPSNKPSAAKDKNPVRYDPVVSKRIPTRSGPTKAVIPKTKLSSP